MGQSDCCRKKAVLQTINKPAYGHNENTNRGFLYAANRYGKYIRWTLLKRAVDCFSNFEI